MYKDSVKSRWFPVAVGLKQGCMLSPLLFNLYTSDLWQYSGAADIKKVA